jgi:3-deoxy-D-manno-octulosonate 8-phosphate phosphatase (KDO 8-P phosphatase)
LRWLITDVDGVLTPATVYYSAAGEELKRFSLRDGMGVELLRAAGIETAFLTREQSPIVQRRAEKLALRHVFLGVKDKAASLPGILEAVGAQLGEVAYMGDDVNDLEIISKVAEVGLTAAPADAVAAISEVVQHRTLTAGGAGAFREFADTILTWRDEEDRP